MIRINEHYEKLASSYLFSTIAKKVSDYTVKNPGAGIIRLGIGDVTLPLAKSCIEAFHSGVEEMGDEKTFRGYGPEQGYDFLRQAIARNDFQSRGAEISPDDIFVSDGAKCDTGNFQEIFAQDIKIAVPDPVYPVYVDTNVMAGRTGAFTNGRYEGLVYLDSTEENGFVPPPPRDKVDLIYLCFPNNPTGAAVSRKQLTEWVDYARSSKALILFDAAYEAFIRDPQIPHSIYEIPGSKEVAVEFRSFSKTAGFTGTRCAFTVIPRECQVYDSTGKAVPLQPLWNRRHTTKFNGVSYPVQKAASAVYTASGKKEVKDIIDYYLENAKIIREKFTSLGFACTGGDNSPYIWVKTGKDSWEFFDTLLEKARIVTTPGVGFGRCGSGYIRVSAFNSRQKVEEAMERIGKII
ncbi:MAG: LL-diaminopimelate aminotransferase [Spirochaetales bacterium]|jgi:LL-diaminopimelate aminotransferase|nr:LL-diaminopimelate aminotransferase [Spirochaetales bacterium]